MNEPRNSQESQLDRLLNDWAQSSTVDAEQLSSLRRQIEERVAAEPLPTGRIERRPAHVARSWRIAAAGAALAATLLAVLVGWSNYVRLERLQDGVAQSVRQPVIPAAPNVADRSQLLAEYQEVFGPELAWLVEQSSRAEIGLRSPILDRGPESDEFVAVRLMLFARSSGDGEWKEVQTLSVVARREELVEIAPETASGAALTLWAFPLDEGMISVDLHYEPSKFAGRAELPGDISIESSSVQSLGKSAPVSSFEREGVEYRLYQSAELLAGKKIG